MNELIKLSNRIAKELIKKYNLNWSWDNSTERADIQCACGAWFNTALHGKVKKLEIVDQNKSYISFADEDNNDLVVVDIYEARHSIKYIKDLTKLGYILFGGNCYKIIPEDEWVLKTFFNKDEYEAFIKENPKYGKDTFDHYWKKYKFNDGKNDLPVGHAFRVIGTGDIYSAEGSVPEKFKRKLVDKVVSFGFRDTNNMKLVNCPLCDEVNKIGTWKSCIPLRYKLKEKHETNKK